MYSINPGSIAHMLVMIPCTVCTVSVCTVTLFHFRNPLVTFMYPGTMCVIVYHVCNLVPCVCVCV
jgi:hypothetical protein